MAAPRRAAALLTAFVAASMMVACSSSSGGGAPSGAGSASVTPSAVSSPVSTPRASPTAQPGQVAQISAAWTAFFAGTTPAARKQALLQSGHAFAAVLAAQSRSAMARSTSVTVSAVHMVAAGVARVIYTILLSGKPALPNQIGTAVRSGGRWRVSASSFCGLLALEGQHPAACRNLPPLAHG
jgi:hypothetical protein